MGPRSPETTSALYLLHFIQNAFTFSRFRKSTWYPFIPPIWILWRLSSFTSIKHTLLIFRVLSRAPGGIQWGGTGHCLVTRHSESTLQLQASTPPNHSTSLGQAKPRQTLSSGEKGTEAPSGAPKDNNHNLQIKCHAMA